jgi:hypothetical protein
VSALMEAGVEFKAADFPDASRIMIQILAAIAEYEAKLISDRTKAGLESRRRRGLPLGNVKNLVTGQISGAGVERAKARAEAERLRPVIDQMKRDGITSLRQIRDTLERQRLRHRPRRRVAHDDGCAAARSALSADGINERGDRLYGGGAGAVTEELLAIIVQLVLIGVTLSACLIAYWGCTCGFASLAPCADGSAGGRRISRFSLGDQ